MAAVEPNKQQLEEAFATFNRVSAELDASYQVLQARIAGLTEELVEARSQRLRELAEKERLANRLALLMAELPGGVVVVSADGSVREANQSAIEFMGMPLVSKKWQDVLDAVLIAESSCESELLLTSGRRLSLNSQYMADVDEQVVLLTDMTRLHELQEEVSRDQRLSALGEMAARLAHQIRTPLSSALLYAGQLNRGGSSAEQRSRVAEKVMVSLRHMENLVATTLNFVRGAPATHDHICVRQLADSAVAATAPLVANAGGKFSAQINIGEPCQIVGDKEALVSALLNLVDNAIAAREADFELTLEFHAHADKLMISVADNGKGIAPEVCARIFDPFFTTRTRGTGLGLAVVAMTARSHGGAVMVTSEPGTRSVFTLELPVLSGSESVARPGSRSIGPPERVSGVGEVQDTSATLAGAA